MMRRNRYTAFSFTSQTVVLIVHELWISFVYSIVLADHVCSVSMIRRAARSSACNRVNCSTVISHGTTDWPAAGLDKWKRRRTEGALTDCTNRQRSRENSAQYEAASEYGHVDRTIVSASVLG